MKMTHEAIVFDLGDVLFDWHAEAVTTVPKDVLRNMMNSTTWHDLERGILTCEETCEILGTQFKVLPAAIQEALIQAQASLRVNENLSALIRELGALAAAGGGPRIYAMTNIAREHFNVLQGLPFPWLSFTRVFTSFDAGMRKPDLRFYRYVLREIGCDASKTVFLDDRPENICAARSLGIHGQLVDRGASDEAKTITISRLLNNLVEDSAIRDRAEVFLRSGAGQHNSVIEAKGISFKDNFSQLLVMEITGVEDIIQHLTWPNEWPNKAGLPKDTGSLSDSEDSAIVLLEGSSLSSHVEPDGTPDCDSVQHGFWNYFAEQPILTTSAFPPDSDTTSVAYLSMPPSSYNRLAPSQTIIDAMVSNVNIDGIVQVYFDPGRPRVDPIVCVNVLRFINKFAGGKAMDSDPRFAPTRDHVVGCLTHRAYLYGTRHYSIPEAFLYFAALLYKECDGGLVLKRELGGITAALTERLRVKVNPLALAMRVRACQVVGVPRELVQPDLQELLSLRDEDGGWPAGHFCWFGRTGNKIGSRGLTTALAWRILSDYRI
ncbi:Haloacid dehalogenase-like hydrolase-domain-containing protein [Podospora didyma]|uniref:Haloacid dehalogenase-like hydrolase-domain-containing protein n=1 Tax=Podospora didyma TaxID=330526 RepID=A0AAE0U2D3_9PEZI|nr:Haloacid dehalogenase-like hydrolase-domain-containing protein [Podospora didyma]